MKNAPRQGKMHKLLRELLFWTWCLPQTLLGAAVYLAVRWRSAIIEELQYGEVRLVHMKNRKLLGGIALGRWNFVTDRRWNDNSQTREHEYGHTRQGFIFGPLYLLVIGIPSAFWLVLSHLSPHIKRTYSERYPENWADRLGGVKK